MNRLPSIVLGWAVIATVVAPVIGGYLVAGEDGVTAVLMVYVGLLILVTLTMTSTAIGDIVKSYRR